MTPEDFLEELQELLRTESDLTMETVLDELDEWDSVAMLAIAGIAEDDFGISLDVNDFKNFVTPRDIFDRLTSHGN